MALPEKAGLFLWKTERVRAMYISKLRSKFTKRFSIFGGAGKPSGAPVIVLRRSAPSGLSLRPLTQIGQNK